MIETSIYQFNKDDAFRFAKMTGIKHRQKGSELEFVLCPYCQGGRHHDKNTFSINLDNGSFNCQRSSCGVKGNMITLAKDFSGQFELTKDVTHFYNIDNANAKFRKFKDAHRVTESKDAAVRYLTSRGITEDVCRRYEVTVKADNEDILVFPFKDEKGELQFIKYRNLAYQKGGKGSKEWCESRCKPILFGMNHCDPSGTLIITEGQIDSLSLATAGIPNAVSVPTGKNGFTWRPHCWNWLIQFDEIVVFGDHENGEITLAKEIASFFPKRVRVVRSEDYRGCKDANEILVKCGPMALKDAVDRAEVKLSNRIISLADVEMRDLSKLEAVKTGFPTLDTTIGGGFHFGDVVVLTGKCGDGKSTVASMMIASALQQNYKVFCYSGELPSFMFKAWLDSQILGKTTIKEADNNAVNGWYRDRIYIYDNSVVDADEDDAFKAIEEAVKNLDCRVILIDNLMTAMPDNDRIDLFHQQSLFVKRCAKFAKAFNVVILLVAHPRKGNGTDNDDISGSGDIANLASLVLRYQRYEKDSDKSMLTVTKNRINGKLLTGQNGIKMAYYEASRRVLEDGQLDSFGPMFEETKLNDGFEVIPESEEIPFM
jgi:twinkle protein